jgi:Fe2+ or Zn2+ uptake regulation protein
MAKMETFNLNENLQQHHHHVVDLEMGNLIEVRANSWLNFNVT